MTIENPQAFPSNDGLKSYDAPGMTLRDYFAAAALTGLLANGVGDCTFEEIVQDALNAADCLLAARQEPSA
jgi:hypothetical protein